MKVGIIGSGGREHAICHTLSNDQKVNHIYYANNYIKKNILVSSGLTWIQI